VPAVVALGTLTTTEIVAEELTPRGELSTHSAMVVPLYAKEEQLQPAGPETDTKVVLVGMASVKTGPEAAEGP